MKSSSSHRGSWLPSAQWLTITFSARCSPAGPEALLRRLNRYLSDTGVTALLLGERLGLVAIGSPVTPLDLGVTITWLISQPEVAMVRPATPDSPRVVRGGRRHV
jgi:hypothetical protein